MSSLARCSVGLLLLAVVVAGGVALLHRGVYGLTLFILFPVLLGGLASWVFRPTTGARAAELGALTLTVAVCSFLALGFEGLYCILMTLPLAVPLGALGGWLFYRAEPSRLATRGSVAMLLLLPPASITWDTQARPPVFEIRSAITIAASPEQVWKHVVTFSELPEPQEWFFRAGLAYPKKGPHRGIRRRRDTLLRVLHRPLRGTNRSLERAAPAAIPRHGESGANARVESLRASIAQAFAWVPGFQARPVSADAIAGQSHAA
jgi:hypothetical protein